MRPVGGPVLFVVTSLACIYSCSNPRDTPDAQARTNAVSGSAVVATAPPAPGSGGDLVSVGESNYWAGNYDSARTLWRSALSRARSVKNDTAEARILTWLGLTSWR